MYATQSQNFHLKKRRDHRKKNSYKCRAYESVDDRSLSWAEGKARNISSTISLKPFLLLLIYTVNINLLGRSTKIMINIV